MLGISQPAVSKYIKNTEDVLGYKLFVRKNGRLRPSPEAELLIPVVSSIFDGVASARRVATELRNDRTGSVKIATVSTLASELVPQAVGSFMKARPQVNVGVKILSRIEVIARVQRQQVDIGLLYSPITEPNFQTLDLFFTELVAVLPSDHILSAKQEIHPKDLIGERLISPSPTTWCGLRIEEAYNSCGVVRHNAVDCSHSEISYRLVSERAGIAIVEPLHRPFEGPRRVAVRPFRPRVEIRAQLFFRNDRPISHLAMAFANKLQEVASETQALRVTDLAP